MCPVRNVSLVAATPTGNRPIARAKREQGRARWPYRTACETRPKLIAEKDLGPPPAK